MKKRSLAILSEVFFTERDCQRFGLNILSKYFDFYLIEFSYPILKNHSINKTNNKEKIYNVVSIENYNDFYDFISNNPLSFYLDKMNSSFLSFRIRLLLKKRNTIRIKENLGLLPWVSYKINLFEKIITLNKRGNLPSKILKAILNKFFSLFEPRVDIFLYSASMSKSTQSYKVTEIWTHSFNYQNYLEFENDDELENIGSFALFIDQYAPSHPDYETHNNKPPVTEKNYYKSMNSFFDFFEKKTELDIIIAGHPRRNQKTKNDWNGRRQIIGKTHELIRKSTIVLSHYSTALSFAVIYRKPILLVTTNEYFNSYRKYQFLAFSEALKTDIINVDKYDENEITNNIYDIDEETMKDYEEKYIRSRYSSSNDIWNHFSKKLLKVKLNE